MDTCKKCGQSFSVQMRFGIEDKALKDCMPEDWNNICLNCANEILQKASHKNIIWIAQEYLDYREEKKDGKKT